MIKKHMLLVISIILSMSLSACGKDSFSKIIQTEDEVQSSIVMGNSEEVTESLVNTEDESEPMMQYNDEGENEPVMQYNDEEEFEPVMQLNDEEELAFRIVLPSDCDGTTENLVKRFAKKIETLTDLTTSVVSDTEAEEENGKEILIGRTSRASSDAAYEDLGYFDYRIDVEGTKIRIAAYNDFTMKEALNVFYDKIDQVVKNSSDGNYYLEKDYEVQETYYEWAKEIPNMTDGETSGIYDAGDETFVIRQEKTDELAYDAYLQILSRSGYETVKTYTLGENRYALLMGKESTLYISWIAGQEETRIYAECAGTKYPTEPMTTQGGDDAPILWQLNVDNKNSKGNAGMSYVLQLSDGSFIIIDGGYNTETEADNLYNHLKAYTPDGSSPTIAAWFITHLHSDHYGCFLEFAKKYNDEVELKELYYNFPLKGADGLDEAAIDKLLFAADYWENVTIYPKLHTGMTLNYCGADVTVICTHEDLYPLTPMDLNDTCTVLRVTAGEQRILFLGDCRDSQCAAMLSQLDQSELKSDIVQFSHHGYAGATMELYKAIGAGTVLWPMNIVGWYEHGAEYDGVPQQVFKTWSTMLEVNRYILESDTVKKIIVAGAGTTALELPYSPSGDKLPDYEAIAQEILKGEE